MPTGAKVAFYAGIFFCFAPIGLLQESVTLSVDPWWLVVTMTLFSGGIALAYAWTIINYPRWFPIPVAVHLGVTFLLNDMVPEPVRQTALDAAGLEALKTRLTILAGLTVASLMGAYSSFYYLIRLEGLRF